MYCMYVSAGKASYFATDPATGLCASGQYVLISEDEYINTVAYHSASVFDAAFAASAFAFFFSAVIVLWATGKACGSVLRVLRRS